MTGLKIRKFSEDLKDNICSVLSKLEITQGLQFFDKDMQHLVGSRFKQCADTQFRCLIGYSVIKNLAWEGVSTMVWVLSPQEIGHQL